MGRRRAAAALLLVVAAVLAGCRVQTNVAVTEQSDGTGVVGVSVALDASALAAVGGRAALAAQLQDADLVAAGWSVTGPAPGPNSTTVVTASHPYRDAAQASALIADLAGSGSPSSRPFRLVLTRHQSFWRKTTTLSGQVDLSCGLACFGDSGLAGATGSVVGVNAGNLAKQAGETPDQVFSFRLTARLPGSVVRTNAASRSADTLEWTPQLGRHLELSAVTQSWQSGHVVGVSIAGGVILLGFAGGGWWWWRRRRRRRRAASQHSSRTRVADRTA